MARSSLLLGLLTLTLVACSGSTTEQSTDTGTDATTPSGGETLDAAGDAQALDLQDLGEGIERPEGDADVAPGPDADGEAALDGDSTAPQAPDIDGEEDVAPPTVSDTESEPDTAPDAESEPEPDVAPDVASEPEPDVAPDVASEPDADMATDVDSATSSEEPDVVQEDPCVDLADGSLCDDGDVCTSGDFCLAGACQPGDLWVCGDPCAQNFDTIQSMPAGSTMIDLETCIDEACCDPGEVWPNSLSQACKESVVEAVFGNHGITLTGGLLTTWVTCITGTEAAPMGGHALHVGGVFKPSPTTYGIEFQFDTPISTFGLTAAPSASSSQPEVILRGYDAAGLEVGYDTFNFDGFPTGGCEFINPLVKFFGFRSCSGQMSRIVAEFTDPNVGVDHVIFFE